MKKILVLIYALFISANAYACDTNQIDVNGNDTQCENTKFSLTTTNFESTGGVFNFGLSAVGTFYVDCGTDGTLSGGTASGKTITRSNTTATSYTCTYSSTGTKTIQFAGTATNYSFEPSVAAIVFYIGASAADNSAKIASISGDLSSMFPYKTATSASLGQPRFQNTFRSATNLTKIPDTLFANYTAGSTQMFGNTFRQSGLTSLPSGLFSKITTPTNYVFYQTFYGCNKLTGYIPASTFSGLISSGFPRVDDMWYLAFANTKLFTTCPSGTSEYPNWYKGVSDGMNGKWGIFVTCVPMLEFTLDTTGAITAGSPATVYLKYGTGWSSDSTGNNVITGLTSLPTKTGKVFGGFYTGQNATGIQIIDADGNFITNVPRGIYQSTTLYAYFGDNSYTATYSCGDGTGTPPSQQTVVSGEQFTPATNSCTKSGYIFAGWAVSGTNDVVNAPFTWNYNANKTLTAQWIETKFSLTTTNFTSTGGLFVFGLSAVGTFYVDCGAGGTLTGPGVVSDTVITRYDTTYTRYSCMYYSTTGAKTIKFAGIATSYGTNTDIATITFDPSSEKIASIFGDLSGIFPYKSANTVSGAQPRFYGTFSRATNLTQIPDTLFSSYTNAKATYMFRSTFYGCTSLTSIPENLFSGVTDSATYMFYSTFSGCTSLSGYIPPSTFAGLIANNSPTATNMWLNTFNNTALDTSCPTGTVQFTTGYESYWDGHVSCVDENFVCSAGEYLPAHWYQCKLCPENNYCTGGTYPYSEITASGAIQCASGLFAPTGMWDATQCGRELHIGENIVYLHSVKKTSPSLHVMIGNNIYYGNMTTLDVPMSRGTQRKLKLRFNDTTYSVYDDSVVLSEP